MDKLSWKLSNYLSLSTTIITAILHGLEIFVSAFLSEAWYEACEDVFVGTRPIIHFLILKPSEWILEAFKGVFSVCLPLIPVFIALPSLFPV